MASILITDRSGRALYEAIDPNGNKHVPRAAGRDPARLPQATIATEDSHFYAIPASIRSPSPARSGRTGARARRSPARSTLTQQLARNLYLTRAERTERTLRRKLREAWLAWRLERTYSKDELLALYLNTTYYGHFATGIEAAAQAYFGIHARELDLAQCALLAGLPQWPAGYNPIENLEAAPGRQAIVLGLMVEHGVHHAGPGRGGRRGSAGLRQHALPHRGAPLRHVGAEPARDAAGRRAAARRAGCG